GLEVVAGDFLQRQEAVALDAVVDEGRLAGGFEPGDAVLVDVGLLLFAGRLFNVDVIQGLAVDDRHAQFFRLRGIDEHSLHLYAFLALAAARAPSGACAGARNAGAFRLELRLAASRASAAAIPGFQRYDTTADSGSAS